MTVFMSTHQLRIIRISTTICAPYSCKEDSYVTFYDFLPPINIQHKLCRITPKIRFYTTSSFSITNVMPNQISKCSDIFIKCLKLNMMSYLTDFVDRIYLFSSVDTPKAYNNAICLKNASRLFNELFISPRNVFTKRVP